MARGSVYEGKTFEEAVRRGLDELGLSRAEATITLIEEGKGGFLGFGARPFRVSIMRRPGGAVREPEEQRERRVSSRRDDRRGGRGGRDRDRGRDREREGGKEGPRRRDEGRRGPQQAVRAEGGRAEGGRAEAGREEGRREEGRREEGRREEGRREEGRREPRVEGRREGRREERKDERREERRDDARREERRPAAAQAPVSAEAGAEEAGADQGERRRRRRGRRGGRGRRREGAPAGTTESTNGLSAEVDDLETTEAFEPQDGFESDEAPVEIVEAHAGTDEGGEESFEPVVASETVASTSTTAQPEAAVAVEAHGSRGSRGSREPREPRESRESPAMAAGELGETSRKLTEELLKAMGFEAKVTVVADGNRADVTAEIAKDDDLLTGQKGEVRQALQHLLNRFLNKGDGSRYHLQLEINDFWFRREKELQDLAQELANRAVSESTEVVTDYLNSQERRIVHVTLKEDPRVKTYALGTGMIKRVAIAPAGFPERTGEEDAG